MRNNTFEDFEDLQIILESAIARGNNAFGLGFGLGIDASAETFEVETNAQEREDVEVVTVTETAYEASKEKLPSRKRAKPNALIS
ncbi:unnamed protein product [Thlaspi arvense]|uniref:Uncharacterized protein n=1 Tax=Thlaspi arvense TaxID=13288 RepID=A0AAU9SEC5_THLAR|nr:unnamed protein product [Thlaspi arvense]